MSEIYCFMTGKECTKLTTHDHRSKKDKKIFALIPFREPYFDYYKFAIKDFYLSNNFECSYGGESAYIDGEYVICKICEEIYKSSLVIADISNNNPNVYYELGIAHGLGKSTIAIVNKNIANESDQDILPFLSGKCDRIYYDGIYSLKCELSTDARNFPIFGNINSTEEEKTEDRYSLMCLIPKERKYERKIEKYAEVYKYGIKEALRNLEFPGDELGGLDKESVCNIIDEARDPIECDVQNIINKISQARYCIIDITENGHQEVFYWLGFIHGLRVNPEVRLRPDLICLYITSGRMKELPFDIRAARIIYYNSIEDLNIKIKKEIEQLEVARIKEHNKEKEKFWKEINVKNTLFLIGALDSYPVGREKETRNRISIQDFKAYNRIIYQLLFAGPRQSFQYNLKELELSNFFDNYKDSLKKIESEGDEWKNIKINDKDEFEKLLLLNQNQKFIENIIIIGSSCVNPAAENIMRVIYSKELEQKPIFKTFHRYKSRSDFWEHLGHLNCSKCPKCCTEKCYTEKCSDYLKCRIENYSKEKCYTEESGIFINNEKRGVRNRCFCPLKNEYPLTTDTALLIICSGKFYMKNLQRNYKKDVKESEKIKGNIILLSGFGKDGTYELSRMLSKINKPDRRIHGKEGKNEEILYKKNKYSVEEYSVEEFFMAINETKKNDSYCIEIILNYKQKCREKDAGKIDCEKCCYWAEQKITIESMMSIRVDSAGKIQKEEIVLKKLHPSPAVDPSASGVTSTA